MTFETARSVMPGRMTTSPDLALDSAVGEPAELLDSWRPRNSETESVHSTGSSEEE